MKHIYRIWFWISVLFLFCFSGYFLWKMYLRKPMISVVMATYNRSEPALPIAIESVLNQTFDDFEFIIVNDGSNDATAELLKKYTDRDSRIRVLSNDRNRGLIYSLNRGLEAARGKYIARMDDDDVSLPWRFEKQVKVLEENPDIAVLGGGITSRDAHVSPSEGRVQLKDPERLEIETYFSSGLAHPTIMIRRSFLEENKLRYSPEYLHAEDCGLYKDILNKGGRLSSIEEPVLRYGFIQEQNKPSEYGFIQNQTFRKVQREKFMPFFDPDETLLGGFSTLKKCLLMKKMKLENKEKKIVSQEMLEKIFSEECPQNLESGIYVEHPYWQDFVSRNGDRLERLNGDKARILSEENGKIKVSWDRYDVEVFEVKNDGTWHYLENADGTVKLR